MKYFFITRFFFIFLGIWIFLFLGIRTAQHYSFGTNACDLSLFDYGMYYTLRGELMYDPFHAGKWESHFCYHFTPILFFIVPFYLIFDGPLFLLYLEVLLVGLSAVPLYFISRNIFKEKYIPLIIAIIYLFFRHLLMGLMHDFHAEMFFPLLFFSSYYFMTINKKPLLYFLLISFALFIKEDIAIYLFFFGVFIFFKIKERKYGLITSVYSLVYFFLVLGLIIPYFRSLEGIESPFVYVHIWGLPSQNFAQGLWNFLTHPKAIFEGISLGLFLRKFSNIVSPLLLLPFFSSYGILIFPPVFVAFVLKKPEVYSFGIHYSATLLPFVFLSLIYGLKNGRGFIERKNFPKAKKRFLLILILLLFINLANSNFWRIINPSRYRALKSYKQVAQIIHKIPREASIAALSSIIPHIPKRKDIYMLPERHEAEYVLVHSGINLWPYTKEEFDIFLAAMKKTQKYVLLAQKGEAFLYRKTKWRRF